jgi:hypothetical protein
MKMQMRIMAALLTAAVVAGCVSEKTVQQSAEGQLLQDAEKYVSGLRQKNQLPGFNSTEHGRIIAAAPWSGGEVTYPTTVIVRAWKKGPGREGERETYRYELAKETPQAPWRMLGARSLDVGGK